MDLLTILIIILIVAWATGSFVFAAGSVIHVLLVIIVVLVIIRLLQGRSLNL